jgi:hypothetical protein
MRISSITLLLLASSTLGCASGAPANPSAPGTEPEPQAGESLLVPPGYGTLLQDQISLGLQSGDLLIKITPLDEGIIRLTAPDTYERLRGLAQVHGPRAARTTMGVQATLFLVSLFSYQPDVTYEPEDLLLVNRGLRLRPQGIAPITPSWGTQRLGQQETRMAVYAFDGGIEWEADLVPEYLHLRNEEWQDRVFPLIQAERAKVRARAGGGFTRPARTF